MTSERMMILEMVKDGKISVDDGVKLLNAINKNSSNVFNDFSNDLKYKINHLPKPDANKIKQNTQAFFNKTEEIFEDFTKSVKDFFNTPDTNDFKDKEETINVESSDDKNKKDNEEN